MKAREIMTRDVVAVSPETSVGEIVRLMTKHHISGVPVVTKDRKLVGMVSQSDLLPRAAEGSGPKQKWWLGLASNPEAMAREYAKAHGQKARDIMARFAVSISPDADLGEVASTLETHKVRRLPVVEGGHVVGIITRSDCVRVLANAKAAMPLSKLDGVALQKAVLEKMRAQVWLNGSYVNVQARGGGLELTGFVESDEQKQALRVLAEEVAGSGIVSDKLVVGMPLVTEF